MFFFFSLYRSFPEERSDHKTATNRREIPRKIAALRGRFNQPLREEQEEEEEQEKRMRVNIYI